MTPHVACTIVARNYVPQARVLRASFGDHNPGVRFATLIVDGLEDDRGIEGVGDVLLPTDLGIDTEALAEMISIYDVMEFSTALKPGLLLHLLRAHGVALYFDPDIEVFDELGDLFEVAEQNQILLTPHVLQPLPRDGRLVSEYLVMLAGIYNLGFLGVGPGAHRFLTWWAEHLRHDAISDPSLALFTDQRWIDWVPALFPHTISRDAGLNAAHWNLHERPISRRDGRLFAGDVPLRFLHFSGYDVRTPWLLSKHPGALPRVLLSDQPELARLCDAYGERLLAAGIEAARSVGYRYAALPGGLALDLPLRRLLRSLVVGETAAPTPPPSPWDEPAAFAKWLDTPSLGEPHGRVTPFEYATWLSRADLRAAFPGVLEDSGNAYRDWFAADPECRQRHESLERRLEPARPAAESAGVVGGGEPLDGWTILTRTTGDADATEIAARITDAIVASGVAVDVLGDADEIRPAHLAMRPGLVVIVAAGLRAPSDAEVIRQGLSGRSVLVILGAADAILRSELLASSYDEVWVVDTGTATEILPARDVRAVRYPVRTSAPATALHRRDYGLPTDSRVALVDLESGEDLVSCGALEAVEAFRSSASLASGAVLAVPTAALSVPDRERLLAIATTAPWLVLVDGDLGVAGRARLVELSDTLLSLHRGPGTRLGELDAVALGTPIVAYRESLSSDLLPGESAGVVDGPGSLAAAVQAALEPGAGSALAARARTATAERLSLAAVAAEYAFLLTEATGGTA